MPSFTAIGWTLTSWFRSVVSVSWERECPLSSPTRGKDLIQKRSRPVAVERLEEEQGRGVHLMKLAMDEVSFRRGGSEVHMRKGPARNPRADLRGNDETVYHSSLDRIQPGTVHAVTQAHARSRQER